MHGQCERQRINLTERQLNERKAPCPKCGKIIALVPNFATKQATMSPHKSAVPAPPVKPDPPARLNVAPVGGKQMSF